jgi:hypothetical protein
LAHRFQAAFKEPLLAAVLPHLRAHRLDDTQLAQRQESGALSPL